jgi:hypothetical protein
MQKMYLSTTKNYADGFLNVHINPERVEDFVDMPFHPGSVELVLVNSLFGNIGVADSCYLLYQLRKWLSRTGTLCLGGHGNLDIDFQTVLLRILYATGFLVTRSSTSHGQPEFERSVSANKYSSEMPDHILIQQICRLLDAFDPTCRSHSAAFLKRLRQAHRQDPDRWR